MSRRVDPAGPPANPFVGHWWQFERDRVGFITDCHRRYGDTVRLHIIRPALLIHDPRDVQHVLIERESNYRKADRVLSTAGQRMFARGLLTRDIPAQRVRRRLVQPQFHRRVMGAFAALIDDEVGRHLDAWGAESIDLTAEIDRLAERILIRALVGDVDEETRARISQTNRARRRLIDDAFGRRFPYPHLLPTRTNWRYRRASRLQRRILARLVQSARVGAVDSRSLLAMMAAHESSEGHRLDNDALVEEMIELLTAGFETRRETFTWAAWLMARHPECAARIRAEADAVVGSGPIEADHLPHLAYAEMFLSEVMRLYPAAWIIMRIAQQDDELPSGAAVRAGWKVYLCPYTSHRNPRYFPDPERFDPGRFASGECESRPRFAYFPFGGGPRVCIAEPLVRVEGVVLLAALARRYTLGLCDDRPVEPMGAITLRPRHPARINVQPI